MKLFIMTDVEGITGVTGSWRLFDHPGKDYLAMRKFLTGDINAAAEGALQTKKVKEITVLDGHGGSNNNIDLNLLNPRVHLLAGERLEEMEGIDSSYNLVFMLGIHAMAGTPKALLTHTFNNNIVSVVLNGRPTGELGMWAAIAGELGVPVGLVAGEEYAIREAKDFLGNIETVSVKKGTSRFQAELIHPSVTAELIKEAAIRAINRASEFKPFKVSSPVELRVQFKSKKFAKEKMVSPDAKLVSGNTVIYKGKTFSDAYLKYAKD